MSAPLWGTLCTALARVNALSSLCLSSWDSGSMQQLCTALARFPTASSKSFVCLGSRAACISPAEQPRGQCT
jgi:hypothetical protein